MFNSLNFVWILKCCFKKHVCNIDDVNKVGPEKNILRGILGLSSIVRDWHQVYPSSLVKSVTKGLKLKVK